MVDYEFILSYDGTDLTLPLHEQPKDFGSVESVLERNLKTHGLFFKFTNQDLTLKFVGTSREFLNDAFLSEGIDAQVTLVINKRRNSYDPYELAYTGQAIMRNRTYNQDFFEVDFQEFNTLSKIQARKGVDYNTNKTTNLEGGAMVNSLSNFDYQSKIIKLQSSYALSSTAFGNINFDGSVTPKQVDTFSATQEAFEEGINEIVFSNQEEALLDGFPSDIGSGVDLELYDDGTTSIYAFPLNNGFLLQREPSISSYDVIIDIDIAFTVSANGFLRYALLVFDVDNSGVESISNIILGTQTSPADGNVEYNDQQTVTVTNTTKKVILSIAIEGTNDPVGFNPLVLSSPDDIFNSPFCQLKATWFSEYPNTVVEGQSLFDSINKNLEYITGEEDLLKSSLLESGGVLGDLFETNGYKVRGFENNGVKWNLKKRLDSLNSIYAIGHGYQKTDFYTEDYEYVVEKASFFYQDVEMISVDDIENDSYSEEYNSFFDFNSIQVGYKKSSKGEDLPNSINDIHGSYQYFLPFDTLIGSEFDINTYDLESDFICSDYLWEITRRRQFSSDATKSFEYDNDLFLVLIGYDNSQLRDSVENVSGDGFNDSEIVETSFNYLLNPKYNLYNHSEIVNSIFFGKALTENISFTGSDLNNDIDFNQTEITEIGDDSGITRNLEEDILISELNGGNRLFDPITYRFRTGISSSELNTIVEGHRNGLETGNYGYISFIDPDGISKSGFLLNLKYNIVDEIATFELIKKA